MHVLTWLIFTYNFFLISTSQQWVTPEEWPWSSYEVDYIKYFQGLFQFISFILKKKIFIMLFDEINPQENHGSQGRPNFQPVRLDIGLLPDVELKPCRHAREQSVGPPVTKSDTVPRTAPSCPTWLILNVWKHSASCDPLLSSCVFNISFCCPWTKLLDGFLSTDTSH